MGPEGGSRGGMVVATGTPEQIAASAESHTGQFLRAVLPEGAPVPAAKAAKPRKTVAAARSTAASTAATVPTRKPAKKAAARG
jgi:excinuclease ABC subunit A